MYIYINPSFSLNVVGTIQPQYEVKLCFSAGRSDRIASYGWISGTSLASQQVSCLSLFSISLKDSWEPTNKWELWLLNSLVVYNLYCWPISHRNYILTILNSCCTIFSLLFPYFLELSHVRALPLGSSSWLHRSTASRPSTVVNNSWRLSFEGQNGVKSWWAIMVGFIGILIIFLNIINPLSWLIGSLIMV